MDQRQSYCLASRQDDFAGPSEVSSAPGAYEILYVVSANDNSPNKYAASSLRWSMFFRRLFRGNARAIFRNCD